MASCLICNKQHNEPIMYYPEHKWEKKCCEYINSLWPGDAIWWHGTRSTLAQVMACCLTAPSHYLNQCWLIISEVPWHSSMGIILRRCEDTNQWNKIENCSFKMASWSPRGQWVNTLMRAEQNGQYFKMSFLQWKLWHFDSNFIENSQ